MKTNFILIVLIAFYSLSCGSAEQTEDSTTETSENQKSSCLTEFENMPCDLLDKSFLAVERGAQDENIEVTKNDEASKMSKYIKAECKYEWPSDRKGVMVMEAAGTVIRTNVDFSNTVTVGDIDIIDEDDFKRTRTDTYVAYFQRVYGIKTKEEKEQIKKTIDRAAKESDKVDDKSAETISNMVDKAPGKKEIEGLGDKAVASVSSLKSYENWRRTNLWVMDRNTIIKIQVDVSDEDEEDLAFAKKIASKILSKCE